MLNKQQGIGGLGILLLLVVLIFALTIVIKVIPAYYDYYVAKKAIIAVVDEIQEQGVRSMNEFQYQLQDGLSKRFMINNLRNIKAKDVTVEDREGEFFVVLKYQVQQPLFGNIILLFNFDYEHPISVNP